MPVMNLILHKQVILCGSRYEERATGHTLCDPKFPATLEPMVFPDPVISLAITPKDKGASEKMVSHWVK